MKVLLKQDMERLGRMGEIVEVAAGYARNYLIPRGLAVGVTRGTVKDIAEQKRVLEVKAARVRESLEALAAKMGEHKVVIKARCSASGRLFGSVTSRQLAQELEAITGQPVDRHKIHMEDKIRKVGTYHALVKLHPDVQVDLEFEVEGEGFITEEPPEEPTEAERSAAAEDSTDQVAEDSGAPTAEETGEGKTGEAGEGDSPEPAEEKRPVGE